MRKLTLLMALLLFFAFQAAAQTEISGTVTDAETGEPIPGVSVVVKSDESVGTTSDMDGNYELTGVPSNAETLVFSFVGMQTQEVPIEGRSTINVEMQQAVQEMEEVVVTALGISREKKSLGYGTSESSGEDISEGGAPDLESGLSGKLSGVEVRQSSGMPGAPSQILIRGATSFSGNNQPLYVVDGQPISSSADYGSNVTGSAFSNRALDISPDQIKSINVLKGQAAASLYGMRASNGVVIIETKSGTGLEMEGTQVNINSTYTLDNVSTLPDIQQKYAQGMDGNFVPGNSFSWGPKIEDLPDDPIYGGNNYEGHEGQYFDPYKNEWVEPKAYNNPENFYNRNGVTFKNSISIDNKMQKGNYSLSFSSANQDGIVKNTGMDRYNAKARGNFQLAEKWDLKFSTNFSKNDVSKLPSGNDSWLFTVYGAPPSFDLADTPSDLSDVEGAQLGEYRQISYRTGAVGNNPYWMIDNNEYKESTNRFFGNAAIEYKPFEWLTAKYQIGLDTYTTDNKEYQEMGTGTLPEVDNLPDPDDRNYGYVEPDGGSIDHYGITRSIVNSLFTINMQHDFNQDLSGSLMLGNEYDDNQSERYGSYGSGFKSPGWDDLANTGVQNSSYSRAHSRTVGFFGEGNLDYKDMLFFNVTGRYDIVSGMPHGNRGFFYPSASLGFVFTEMDIFDNIPALSYGKLRGSYSEVGQAAGSYRPEPVFVGGGVGSGFLSYYYPEYPIDGVTGYKPSAYIYDKGLTPQNSRSYEFGIDLQFFDGRLGLDYTYFDQSNEDQIFGVPIAGSTGYAEYYTNAGNMTSKGHEILLSLTPVQTRNFSWTSELNFSTTDNVVQELAEGVESISLGGYVTPNVRASAGDSYPAIYGETFQRDEEGNILIDDDPESSTYGMPMAGEFGLIGEVTPDFNAGMRNTFTLFERFTISAHLHWKEGGEMYSGSNRLIRLYGTAGVTEDRTEPFVHEGVKASTGEENDIELNTPEQYQKLYSDVYDAIPESAIEETSFLKLRSASFTYNLPEDLFSNFFITKASIGFSVRNVLIWSTLDNFDPETSQGQGNMQGGMDYMSLPHTESYGFNINLTF